MRRIARGMNKTLRFLIPVACVGAFSAAAVFAAGKKTPDTVSVPAVSAALPEGRPLMKFALRRVADELDLTEAQLIAAKEIIRQHYGEVHVALDNARAVRAELRGVIRSGKADDASLAAAADKVAAAAREVAVTTARLRADLQLVLDDEQRAKIEMLEARWHKRVDDLREALAEEFGPAV